jgi:hypothetical protein
MTKRKNKERHKETLERLEEEGRITTRNPSDEEFYGASGNGGYDWGDLEGCDSEKKARSKMSREDAYEGFSIEELLEEKKMLERAIDRYFNSDEDFARGFAYHYIREHAPKRLKRVEEVLKTRT